MVNTMDNKKSKKIKKILKNSSVGIAGVGGLGSNVAVSLARAGVGCLLLVDFDKVEKSNLNRQYFFSDQIGLKKVKAIEDIIKNIDKEIDIKTFDYKLDEDNCNKVFSYADVIVEALDSAEQKTSFIENIMNKLPEKPVVGCSGVSGYGNISRIKYMNLGRLHMIYDDKAKDCQDDVLMAPRVALMANWQANVVLEILLGEDK